MKVGVVGSRSFKDYELLKQTLDSFPFEITQIISGGASGADTLAEWYAFEKKIPLKVFRPDWKKFGKRAGFLRNSDIVNNSTHIIGFHNGTSRGTMDTIQKAKDLGIPVTVIIFEEESFNPKPIKGSVIPL